MFKFSTKPVSFIDETKPILADVFILGMQVKPFGYFRNYQQASWNGYKATNQKITQPKFEKIITIT